MEMCKLILSFVKDKNLVNMDGKTPTLKSLINEQGGLVLRITLKRACSFIRDFRVEILLVTRIYRNFLIIENFFDTFPYLHNYIDILKCRK